MNTNTLNVEYLKRLGACDEGIKFVEVNGLEGFPLSRLDEIRGDFNHFKSWLLDALKAKFEYDTEGHITKVVYPDEDTYRRGTYLYGYDNKGNMTKSVSPGGSTRLYEYDTVGNIVKATYADGDIDLYEYDTEGNMVKKIYPNGGTYLYGYDTEGNMTKSVNPDGDTYIYEYDTRGNMTVEVGKHYTSRTEYAYHKNGSLHSISRNGTVVLDIPEF